MSAFTFLSVSSTYARKCTRVVCWACIWNIIPCVGDCLSPFFFSLRSATLKQHVLLFYFLFRYLLHTHLVWLVTIHSGSKRKRIIRLLCSVSWMNEWIGYVYSVCNAFKLCKEHWLQQINTRASYIQCLDVYIVHTHHPNISNLDWL